MIMSSDGCDRQLKKDVYREQQNKEDVMGKHDATFVA